MMIAVRFAVMFVLGQWFAPYAWAQSCTPDPQEQAGYCQEAYNNGAEHCVGAIGAATAKNSALAAGVGAMAGFGVVPTSGASALLMEKSTGPTSAVGQICQLALQNCLQVCGAAKIKVNEMQKASNDKQGATCSNAIANAKKSIEASVAECTSKLGAASGDAFGQTAALMAGQMGAELVKGLASGGGGGGSGGGGGGDAALNSIPSFDGSSPLSATAGNSAASLASVNPQAGATGAAGSFTQANPAAIKPGSTTATAGTDSSGGQPNANAATTASAGGGFGGGVGGGGGSGGNFGLANPAGNSRGARVAAVDPAATGFTPSVDAAGGGYDYNSSGSERDSGSSFNPFAYRGQPAQAAGGCSAPDKMFTPKCFDAMNQQCAKQPGSAGCANFCKSKSFAAGCKTTVRGLATTVEASVGSREITPANGPSQFDKIHRAFQRLCAEGRVLDCGSGEKSSTYLSNSWK